MTEIASAYSYDLHLSPTVDCVIEEGVTKQSFKDECDVNKIIERFERTGELPQGSRVMQYGDFSSVFTFEEAQERLLAAQEAFEELPARVRERFGNDIGVLVEFASREENADEMIALGLLEQTVANDDNPDKPLGAEGAPAEEPATSPAAPAEGAE